MNANEGGRWNGTWFFVVLAIIMAIVVAPCRFTPLFVLVLVCVFAFAFVFVHELLWGMRFHFVSFHFVSSRLVWFCLPESSEQQNNVDNADIRPRMRAFPFIQNLIHLVFDHSCGT